MEQQTLIDDRGKRSDAVSKEVRLAVNRDTPSSLDKPVFLMNPPFTADNKSANNALMKDVKPYNKDKAHDQSHDLYSTLVSYGAMVYLLPSTHKLQDLPFVANLGIYLPHCKPDTVIVSNFKSPPRKGEDQIGIKFFKDHNYAVHQPKTTWEGEADLKWIEKNNYIGGYGIRTDPKTFNWMSDKFEMNIIDIKMNDEKLYHFDCMFFPTGDRRALVTTSAISKSDLKKIEKLVEVVPVPKEYEYWGWTNCVKIGDKVLHGTSSSKDSEKALNKCIEKMGFEPVSINLSEFDKSGADCSCMAMHLNYYGR